MARIYLILAFILTIPISSYCQAEFEIEASRFFSGIPIDSPFEKIATYALNNNFSFISAEGDSSTFSYVLKSSKPGFIKEKIISSYIFIDHADSMFAGDLLYNNSISIYYTIKFTDYKSIERAYKELIANLYKSCNNIESIKSKDKWYFDGIKFHKKNVSGLPLIYIEHFGKTLTIKYLREN